MKKFLVFLALVALLVPGASALTLDVLTTDPAPLQAGSFADVTIEIESAPSEEPFTNLNIGLVETPYIRPISTTDGEFATFRPARVATFTFRIFIEENIPEGFIDLEFYAESDGLERSTYNRRVFIQESDSEPELYIGSIKTTPKELLPDTDDVRVDITLQNLGDKDAELVKATLISGDLITPAYSYSMEDSVSSIPSGGQATLSFVINIDEEAMESLPAKVELRYRSEDVGSSDYITSTVQIPFDLQIVPAPFLEIVSIEQLDSFQGGSTENRVRVGIQNNGLAQAEEVRVRIIPDISYPFIFETTTQYVASTIQPGDISYVLYVAEVTDDAQSNNYTITTKLESLVGDARYTREDVLVLETTPGDSLPPMFIAIGIIAVVLILAIYIGVRARKRK
jgi:hypothetical protein